MDSKDLLKLQVSQRAQKPKIEVEEITTDLIASFKAIELNLHWEVENVRKGVGILSGNMDCQRFPQTFQFGLRYVEDVAVVSLMVMNLHHLGLRVALVRLAYNNGKPVLMTRKTNETRCSKLDLFSQEFLQGLDKVSGFTCQVYLEGVVNTYIYQQYDSILNDQLWNSVLFCCWTDFKFFIGDNVFNVHKFVLSARSCRLEDEVSHVESIRLSDDFDPETFKCFLHFLYTGRLLMNKFKAPILNQLRSLAEKYDLETLKQICQEDLTKLKATNFPDYFMSSAPAAEGPPAKTLDRETKSKICSKPDSYEIRFTWDVNRLPQDYLIRAVNFNNEEVFHVCFRSGVGSKESKRNQALFFFSKEWPEGGLEVVNVNVCVNQTGSTNGMKPRSKQLAFSKWPKIAGLDPAMAIFSVDIDENALLQVPITLRFRVDLSLENARQYSYQPRDFHLAQNLWSATFGAYLTDTEINVNGRIFRVHKALVAARSPVMRELLSSKHLNETSLKPIVVEDVEPSTFEEMLFFMYTGSLRVSAADPKLLMAAEKYQIETLKFLCENQVKNHDRSLQDLCSFLQMVA